MEKKFRGASTSGQINTACAEENAELGATEPNRNDGSRCLCQDSSQKQPTTSCSSVSYEGLEEELSAPGKEAASEMNGPEYKHPPCLPDITNSSFEEIINILREIGGRSDDGMIKVDAEYLRDCLGEEKAKKLVKYFNKNATSMDLVITEGAWGFNQDPTASDKEICKEIPEWCIAMLRDLVVRLSASSTAMSAKWKEACEDCCEILQDTLNNVDATTQKQNEIYEAAINDMKEDFRRANIEHEQMVQKLWYGDDVPSEVEQEDSEVEQNSGGESQNRPSIAPPSDWAGTVVGRIFNIMGQTKHQQASDYERAEAAQKPSGRPYTSRCVSSMDAKQTNRSVAKIEAALLTATPGDVEPLTGMAQHDKDARRSNHQQKIGETTLEHPHPKDPDVSTSLQVYISRMAVYLPRFKVHKKKICESSDKSNAEMSNSEFLQEIILPYLESTPISMLPCLKTELINIASEYSEGKYPKELAVSKVPGHNVTINGLELCLSSS
ncbi:uncharacterized protein LOC144148723 isoform X2 [Haemaphysalis longicornis]